MHDYDGLTTVKESFDAVNSFHVYENDSRSSIIVSTKLYSDKMSLLHVVQSEVRITISYYHVFTGPVPHIFKLRWI